MAQGQDGRVQSLFDRHNDQEPIWRLPAILAVIGVVISVIGATATSAWILSSASAKIETLTNLQERDHNEATKNLNNLITTIYSLSNQTSALTAQVDNLKALVAQERTDRVELEHRIFSNGRR